MVQCNIVLNVILLRNRLRVYNIRIKRSLILFMIFIRNTKSYNNENHFPQRHFKTTHTTTSALLLLLLLRLYNYTATTTTYSSTNTTATATLPLLPLLYTTTVYHCYYCTNTSLLLMLYNYTYSIILACTPQSAKSLLIPAVHNNNNILYSIIQLVQASELRRSSSCIYYVYLVRLLPGPWLAHS